MKSTLLNCKSFVPPLMEAVRQYDELALPPLTDILGERNSSNIGYFTTDKKSV